MNKDRESMIAAGLPLTISFLAFLWLCGTAVQAEKWGYVIALGAISVFLSIGPMLLLMSMDREYWRREEAKKRDKMLRERRDYEEAEG